MRASPSEVIAAESVDERAGVADEIRARSAPAPDRPRVRRRPAPAVVGRSTPDPVRTTSSTSRPAPRCRASAVDLALRRAHRSGGDHAAAQLYHGGRALPQQRAEALPERGLRDGELVQVAVEEPVFATSARTAGAARARGPRRRRGDRRDRRSSGITPRLERRVQLADDLVLVAEVVVEIAGADVHLVGDVRRRDVRRAVAVEQREAGLEDPLAGAAGALLAGMVER